MGMGKKKWDAVVPTGHLKVMAWEREPLTEVQPLSDEGEPPSDLDDRRALKGNGQQDKK